MKSSHRLMVACLLLGAPLSAPALTWNVGGADVALESSLTAGLAWRITGRDNRLVGIGNGGHLFSTNSDDGNLAFEDGDIISSPIKFTTELSVDLGSIGVFVRGSAVYNAVLNSKDYFDAADYGPGKEFAQAERERKNELVRDEVGAYVDLLDAYIYGGREIGDRYLSFKLGRQVINWGEATLVQNGLNSLLALNANRLRVPGFQIEEVIIPTSALWLAVDITDNIAAEAFYQLEWERTVPDASGTFFATNDFAFDGGSQANLGFGRIGENTPANPATYVDPAGGRNAACIVRAPVGNAALDSPCATFGSTVPRLADRQPGSSGQYGGLLRFFIPALNEMDLGVYAARYHSRLPTFSGISRSSLSSAADDAGYLVEYPEDIQMYGLSFNTLIESLGIALQGEYSFKVDQPLQLDDVELLLAGLGLPSQLNRNLGATLGNQYIRGWRRHDVSQLNVSFTRIIGPHKAFHWDQLTILGEVAGTQVHGLPDSNTLRYEAPNTSLPGDARTATILNLRDGNGALLIEDNPYATAGSWGYKLVARAAYNNLVGGINFQPTLLWQHDVDGITPAPITNFLQDRRSMTAILGWDYLNRWSGSIAYQANYGGGIQNAAGDRDFLSMHLTYNF